MNRLPKVLSREEVQRYLDGVPLSHQVGLRNRVALELMYGCGLRVSEVCNLTLLDVRLSEGYVVVQLGKGAKDRVVPLPARTAEWCRRWLEEQRKRIPGVWFLPTLEGGKVSTNYYRDMCRRLSNETGIYLMDGARKKAVHPHTLRHCFGTELAENKVPLPQVAALMGHADRHGNPRVATTQVYLSVRPQHLKGVMENRFQEV